ncbi:MAG: AAA family ATPase [Bacteroidia bacterium]|nr:AAA family ATPase [Bacteroidia bacterium]
MEKTVLEKQAQQTAYLITECRKQFAKVIVGQSAMIDAILMALINEGHLLIEGLPGLAKTLSIITLSKITGLSFRRIQFTPDLLPADIIGTSIFNPKTTLFEVRKGPIFSQVILADEINRAPAKVQSALLEAMQERQVTIGDETHRLPRPFIVLGTQNPLEQEGTYPLPEAQIDRFLARIFITYPNRSEELMIMRQLSNHTELPQVQTIIGSEEIQAIQKQVNSIAVNERLEEYMVDIVRATREPAEYQLSKWKNYIRYGASPRATIALNRLSRTQALFSGRTYTTPDDVKAVAGWVLNHRIGLSFEALAEGVTVDTFLKELLLTLPI